MSDTTSLIYDNTFRSAYFDLRSIFVVLFVGFFGTTYLGYRYRRYIRYIRDYRLFWWKHIQLFVAPAGGQEWFVFLQSYFSVVAYIIHAKLQLLPSSNLRDDFHLQLLLVIQKDSERLFIQSVWPRETTSFWFALKSSTVNHAAFFSESESSQNPTWSNFAIYFEEAARSSSILHRALFRLLSCSHKHFPQRAAQMGYQRSMPAWRVANISTKKTLMLLRKIRDNWRPDWL